MRKDVQGSGIRSAVDGLNAHAKILCRRLAVFDKYVEIAVLVENPGVQKFELKSSPSALPVFLQQPLVWVPRLRVFVEVLHVGMGRSAVEVEVVFLGVFAMIAFAGRQTKDWLLQN